MLKGKTAIVTGSGRGILAQGTENRVKKCHTDGGEYRDDSLRKEKPQGALSGKHHKDYDLFTDY